MKRRVFLKGVAGAAVAAPFLSSLYEKKARGQSTAAKAPKRLVMFYTHNGCLTDRWFPKVENGALTTAALAGTTLEPLTPYLSKLLIPRGFKSLNQYGTTQSIDPHDQAMGSKLTCALINNDTNRYASATSLDHVIAQQINPNGNTPLVLSVGAASTKIKEILSFSSANTPFPAIVNPTTVYTQLTGIFGSSTTTPADYHVMRGQSAIDLVKGDLTRYQSLNMSQADQSRIKDWLDLLRTTETGVMNTPTACSQATAEAAPFGVTAAAVAAGSPTGTIAGGVFGGNNTTQGLANLATSFTLGGDLMLNLMALNMICDVNRVLLMLYPGYVTFNWDGIMHTHDHHGLSHRTGDLSVGGACGVANVLDMIDQIDQWYAGKYAKLVGLLNSIGEGDGTLLDNTATMWLQELSDGAAHNLNNLPIVIAGSAGGYLKQGYAVNVENKGTIGVGNSDNSCADGTTNGTIGNTGSSGGNLPINKLYVTLMNAVGCTQNGGKVTSYGVFDGSSATGGITNPGEVTSLTAGG